MIIAPFVEKNKPICPCQCKNSNEYMHTKKIDNISYTEYTRRLTTDTEKDVQTQNGEFLFLFFVFFTGIKHTVKT